MITEGIVANIMTEDDYWKTINNKKKVKKLTPEVFGGIEFVRVCSLPESEKKKFWRSPMSKKVIMILRDKEILSDCIYYKDYCDFELSNLESN